MDLNQRKLTRDEWNSIEKPISLDELNVVQLIKDGYSNVHVKRNNTLSILQFLKVVVHDNIDTFIFTHYIQKQFIDILNISKRKPFAYTLVAKSKTPIRSSDRIRFNNTDLHLAQMKENLFEFIWLDVVKQTLKKREKHDKAWVVGFFTLQKLIQCGIHTCNRHLSTKLESIVKVLEREINIKHMVYRSVELIEHNPYLLKYADDTLYDHQKKLFTQFKQSNGKPQLVLYVAPTGTGKTLSPLGLAQQYKVIFVCAARHVGLALAKYAINSGQKVAFAFGCNETSDIRLHYNAAKEYTRHWRSGSITKVDNSVGERAEIVISDIKSYIYAMHYMCAFNEKSQIITYWDEPTISLDYKEHPCHQIIQENWKQNIIPNMVLSSATLPNESELLPTIQDFVSRFENAEVTSIVSFDCKKTIPLINKGGFIEVPHTLYTDYTQVKKCAEYCTINKSLLRYIDLKSCVEFIEIINETHITSTTQTHLDIESQFPTIESVNMLNVKLYYLTLLQHINPDKWPKIQQTLTKQRKPRHVSNIMVSTADAHTLTDGPTIFLADDVNKIGIFCLQKSNIPSYVLTNIRETIAFNAMINEKIATCTKTLEDLTAKDEESGNDKKLSDLSRGAPEVKKIRTTIHDLRKCIKTVQLPDKYVPNTAEHLSVYAKCMHPERAFKSDIELEDVEKIMLIDDIDDMWKLLLMMGIGVFASQESDKYMEIMKYLAQEQKLYLIIASTDFIYGTNYQFCHGYLSNDLEEISQEKAIQALGRVGRNKLQYDYTFRFRNDSILKKLFEHDSNKPEVANMARLFKS